MIANTAVQSGYNILGDILHILSGYLKIAIFTKIIMTTRQKEQNMIITTNKEEFVRTCILHKI